MTMKFTKDCFLLSLLSNIFIFVLVSSSLTQESSAFFPLFANGDDDKIQSLTSKSSRSAEKISCKDENGDYVDWFIVYKLPKVANATGDDHLGEGSAHYYLLPKSTKWTRSEFAINDSKSLIGKTMKPLALYNDTQQTSLDDLAVILYNDQPPDVEATIKDGHSKGVVIANSLGSLWMPHSIPHFPKLGPLFYPTPGGFENGQMLFCLSLPLEKLDEIVGGILYFTKATFYNSSISSNLHGKLTKLMDAIGKNQTGKTPPWYKQFDLSVGQLDLTIFAKGPKFHREIYADWIAPYFNTSLDVQSWLNGQHPFVSNCTSNCSQVYNIMEKQMLGHDFSYIDDHSKWGISSTDVTLVCITDLNRMKPQKARGGVGLCFKNDLIWNEFKSLVKTIQPCGPVPSLRLHNQRKPGHQKAWIKKRRKSHFRDNAILKLSK